MPLNHPLSSSLFAKHRLLPWFAMTAIAGVSFLSGCAPAVSLNPLYTSDEAGKPLRDTRIEGEWISTDPDKAKTEDSGDELAYRWKVVPPERWDTGSTYSVEIRPAKPDTDSKLEAILYDVQLVALGDKLFFDADFQQTGRGGQKIGRDAIIGTVPVHLLGRVWVEGDLLRLAFLESDWVKEQATASRQTVHVGSYNDVAVLTGTTEELRKLLLKNAENEKALVPFVYLCRPGTDCSLRGMNEELRRHPEDDELLRSAAEFLTARGEFARAVELLRRAARIAPENASNYQDAGEALLLLRDYAGARKEFANAERLSSRRVGQAEEREVWSYFLEGKWEEVPRAAAKSRAVAAKPTAEPILLSYYSLLRFGRKADAAAYLAEEAAKFKGALADHALLLRAQDRATDNGLSSPPKSDEQRRAYFFEAVRAGSQGNAPWAKSTLQSAADKAPKDSVIALAAKIELERFAATVPQETPH